MTPARFRRRQRSGRGRGRPRSDGMLAAEVWREVAECEAQLGPRSHSSAVMMIAAQRRLSERHIQRLLTEHKRNLRVAGIYLLRPGKDVVVHVTAPAMTVSVGSVTVDTGPGPRGLRVRRSALRRRRSRTRPTGASIDAAVDVAAGDKAALLEAGLKVRSMSRATREKQMLERMREHLALWKKAEVLEPPTRAAKNAGAKKSFESPSEHKKPEDRIGTQHAGFIQRLMYHSLDSNLRAGRMSTVLNGEVVSEADARRMVAHGRAQGWIK